MNLITIKESDIKTILTINLFRRKTSAPILDIEKWLKIVRQMYLKWHIHFTSFNMRIKRIGRQFADDGGNFVGIKTTIELAKRLLINLNSVILIGNIFGKRKG